MVEKACTSDYYNTSHCKHKCLKRGKNCKKCFQGSPKIGAMMVSQMSCPPEGSQSVNRTFLVTGLYSSLKQLSLLIILVSVLIYQMDVISLKLNMWNVSVALNYVMMLIKKIMIK